MSTSEFVFKGNCLYRMPNFEAIYSHGPLFVNLGILPRADPQSAPCDFFCPWTGGGWALVSKVIGTGALLPAHGGATLCPLSMIEGTDVPLWAI